MTDPKTYEQWVRTLPCVITGATGDNIDCHHIKGYNYLTGAGMGKKGARLLCIPLRHDVHMDLHNIGYENWEFKHNRSQLEEAVETILLADKLGIIKVDL